jgi:uncharacterized membrane protein YqaE (UPF0057 family)
MDSPNIYITLVLIGITIIAVKKINIFQQEVEHFGNPLEIIQKIGKGMMDFFLSLLDIFLVIGDVFSWVALLPFLLLDLILLLITWLWPITMIKGVVSAVFTIVKILILGAVDFIIHIIRMFFAKIFGYLKGGLWGIPHTPEEHHSHTASTYGTTGSPDFERTDEYGDHHHHEENITGGTAGLRYRPLRCYRGISNNGFINIAATIICPPLGVFMAFGLKAYMRIFLCCVLSLAYYIPGLVYALLITTHLGLGRTITAKDCGGTVNYGLRIAGCTGLKTKQDCIDAMIPGWRDANDNEIRACGYHVNEGVGKCYNIIYPSGVHTIGDRYRYLGETGYESGDGRGETIDKTAELAFDYEDGDKIQYDPIGHAKSLADSTTIADNIDPGDGSQPYKIPEGPWKYMGDD